MNKYWLVARNTWDEMLTYRLNFVMWRLRTVFQLLTIYFLWLALIPHGGELFGYSQMEILTYILGTALIGSLVLSSRSHAIGDDINEGNLSNFLLRPINYFFFWMAKDAADKTMNIAFSIVELTILFVVLKPPLLIQADVSYLLLFLIASIVALILWFIFNVLIGLIGFWSPEVWAPRFILMIVITFTAGGLFPLDILPKPVFAFVQLLPFTYLLYFPVKVYLGQLTFIEVSLGLAISLFWVVFLLSFIRPIWMRGLRLYTAQGR